MVKYAQMKVKPLTLTGRVVRLAPLSLEHVPALAQAGSDPGIWQFMPYGVVDTEDKMRELVHHRLRQQANGTDLPFTVFHLADDRVVGMTCFMDIRPADRALEIGSTWYAPAYQRTAVNTECKYLLLCHAFEALGCIRVQLKTDLRNERSQRAIERLGAVREGVLRDHMILPDGTVRSSVYYSILKAETRWREVYAETMARYDRDLLEGKK
jgi:RimJ/RimL family protein N-acetyltransferase